MPETSLPQEVSDILQRAEKAGITCFEPYHLSDVKLEKFSNVEGWKKKPEDWYWKQIEEGNITDINASKLPGAWVLMDKTQKPDYLPDGKQMYEKDPLGQIIAKLREEGKINPFTPKDSRFFVSPQEISQHIAPTVAMLLGVDKKQVRLPTEIEFNIIGNMKHPEWGETNTWELFNDGLAIDGHRLVGGDSGHGGLGGVDHVWGWSGNKALDGFTGFRLLIVVPQKV